MYKIIENVNYKKFNDFIIQLFLIQYATKWTTRN